MINKQSIGKMLLSKAEEMCLEQGCFAIELTSANFRTGAHAFCERLGYTVKQTNQYIQEI